MEQVLIVDPDHNHAIDLKEALEAVHCHVSVHHDHRAAIHAVIPQGLRTLVFVSSSPTWWRNDLKALCESLADAKHAIDIVCLLRWSSIGPADRLFGDQLNVRVLHEQ